MMEGDAQKGLISNEYKLRFWNYEINACLGWWEDRWWWWCGWWSTDWLIDWCVHTLEEKESRSKNMLIDLFHAFFVHTPHFQISPGHSLKMRAKVHWVCPIRLDSWVWWTLSFVWGQSHGHRHHHHHHHHHHTATHSSCDVYGHIFAMLQLTPDWFTFHLYQLDNLITHLQCRFKMCFESNLLILIVYLITSWRCGSVSSDITCGDQIYQVSGVRPTILSTISNEQNGNNVGYRMLDVGCWMLDVGCWMLNVGCWMMFCFIHILVSTCCFVP